MAKSRTVRFDFDPFEATGEDLPEGADEETVLESCAEFIQEQILSYVGDETSPVAGYGPFPALTKEYAKRKKALGHPPEPNLLLRGEMLDALQVDPKGSMVRIQITGQQGAKADGHCNQSGDSSLPLRRFIPNKGETFESEILDGVARIIRAGG